MNSLPSGWDQTTGDCLFTYVTSGSRGWARYYADEGAQFIRVGNLQRTSISPDLTELQHVKPPLGSEGTRTQVAPNDILISITADLGRVGLMSEVSEDTYINQHVALARPVKEVNARYLAWYLSSNLAQQQWGRYQRGVTRLGLGLNDIRSIKIPIAPLPEQQRIVDAIDDAFSRIDAGVKALEHTRKHIKGLRLSVLNSLTVDPSGADWSNVELADVLSQGRYGTSTKCSYDGSGLPVLRIPNVQSGQISYDDIKYAVEESANLSSSVVSEDDILIVRTNGSRSLIGRAAVVHSPPSRMAFASYLIQLRVDTSILNPDFLAVALASPTMRRRIEQLAATTAGQYNISLAKLRSLRIPVPPLSRQQAALANVGAIEALVSRFDKNCVRLLAMARTQRSAILSSGFSGQLVSQDPEDEPASALLDRIAAERTRYSEGAVRTRRVHVPENRITA